MQTQNGKNDSKVEYYDPVERARQKQLARDKDDEDLRTGKITKEELKKQNGFFSSLNIEDSKVILKRG